MLALGVTAMVLFQSLINFAVVLGMMPTKGIPLPVCELWRLEFAGDAVGNRRAP